MVKTLAIVLTGLGLALAAQSGAQTGTTSGTTVPVPPKPAVPAPGTSSLTGQIMQRLANDPVLRNYAITASVGENNVVSLNGVVPSQALDDRAIEAVKTMPGVTRVVSNILVNVDPFAPAPPASSPAAAPPVNAAPPPPPALNDPQSKLADALARHTELKRVQAQVYDHEVIVMGTVTDAKAKQTAENLAKQIIPGAPVENLIWVDPHPIAPPPMVPSFASPAGGPGSPGGA